VGCQRWRTPCSGISKGRKSATCVRRPKFLCSSDHGRTHRICCQRGSRGAAATCVTVAPSRDPRHDNSKLLFVRLQRRRRSNPSISPRIADPHLKTRQLTTFVSTSLGQTFKADQGRWSQIEVVYVDHDLRGQMRLRHRGLTQAKSPMDQWARLSGCKPHD